MHKQFGFNIHTFINSFFGGEWGSVRVSSGGLITAGKFWVVMEFLLPTHTGISVGDAVVHTGPFFLCVC
jgi:hypothetical protein